MQAIKNGIKTTLRTPGKTALFLLILTVLSVLLSVAFCVFSSVRGYIKDADSYFHTIANLEYIGRDYPDQTVYDPAVAEAVQAHEKELERLCAHPSVMDYESASTSLGLVEGLHRMDKQVYAPNAVVLLVNVYAYDRATNLYSVSVVKSLYSQTDYTDKLIYITADGMSAEDGPLEKGSENGTRYLICGNYVKVSAQSPAVSPRAVSFIEGGESVQVPAIEAISGTDIPENSVFLKYADMLRLCNNACRVTGTKDLNDIYPFHQQILTLANGRLFTADEQENGANVCLITQDIAYRMELSVGDSIKLSVFASDSRLFDVDSIREKESGSFEIIGVLNTDDDYPYRIFLPGRSDSELKASSGYTLGRFRIKNDRISEFLNEFRPLSEQGFRAVVYDQGYAQATEPMRELEFISIVFLAVCLLLAAVALILQSHVFVSRQRDAAQTMYSLGSGSGHIFVYYLSAALLLTLLGAAAGGFIARAIEGRVFEVMQRFATQFAESDTSFSSSRLSMIRTLDFSPKTELKTYLTAAVTLAAGAAATTLIFTGLALSEGKRAERRRAKKPKDAAETAPKGGAKAFRGKTSRLSGRLKYAILSIGRSPVRTAAILLLSAVAALFFSRLNDSLRGYELQLENYKRDAVITGYATDIRGRWMDGLIISKRPVKNLVNEGLTTEHSVTKKLGGIDVLGVAIEADGTEHEVPYSPPTGGFSRETRLYNLSRSLKWVAASDFEASPAFKYAQAKNVTWLEGFDKKDFINPNPVCALSESVMKEHGIALGDCVQFECTFNVENSSYIGLIILKVAASYSSSVSSSSVFVPLVNYPYSDEIAEWEFVRLFSNINGVMFAGSPDDEPAIYDPNLDYSRITDVRGYFKAVSELYQTEYAPDPANSDYESAADKHITADTNAERGIKRMGRGITSDPAYASFLFTLKSAEKLDETRQALKDSGFTYVGSYDRSKTYAVIDDEMFLNTTRSMQRQIQYVSALYYALYVIAGIIGFALAWLLAVSRRREIALMRALGTSNSRITLNFFFEHSLLCALGLAIGLGISYLAFGAPLMLCLMLSAAFLALWCISTLLCLLFGLAKKAQAALTEIE